MPTMKTFALFCLLTLRPLATDTVIVGKVVGVHDGDTLTLCTEDETLKVQLSGIDTPELGRPFPVTGGFNKDVFER